MNERKSTKSTITDSVEAAFFIDFLRVTNYLFQGIMAFKADVFERLPFDLRYCIARRCDYLDLVTLARTCHPIRKFVVENRRNFVWRKFYRGIFMVRRRVSFSSKSAYYQDFSLMLRSITHFAWLCNHLFKDRPLKLVYIRKIPSLEAPLQVDARRREIIWEKKLCHTILYPILSMFRSMMISSVFF